MTSKLNIKNLKGTGILGKNTAKSILSKFKLNRSSESDGSNSISGVKSSYPKEYKDVWAEQEDKHYADYKHYSSKYKPLLI